MWQRKLEASAGSSSSSVPAAKFVGAGANMGCSIPMGYRKDGKLLRVSVKIGGGRPWGCGLKHKSSRESIRIAFGFVKDLRGLENEDGYPWFRDAAREQEDEEEFSCR